MFNLSGIEIENLTDILVPVPVFFEQLSAVEGLPLAHNIMGINQKCTSDLYALPYSYTTPVNKELYEEYKGCVITDRNWGEDDDEIIEWNKQIIDRVNIMTGSFINMNVIGELLKIQDDEFIIIHLITGNIVKIKTCLRSKISIISFDKGFLNCAFSDRIVSQINDDDSSILDEYKNAIFSRLAVGSYDTFYMVSDDKMSSLIPGIISPTDIVNPRNIDKINEYVLNQIQSDSKVILC